MSYLYFSIDSAAKSAGSASNSDFRVALPTPVTGVKDVRLAALSLPNVFQRVVIVAEVNDAIDFQVGVTQYNATIAPGSYTGTTLAAAVAAAMNATAAPPSFTAAYNSTTNRITISYSGGNFSLLFASGTEAAETAANALGFLAVDLSGAATYTSDGGLLLSPSSVFIGCDTLSINVRQTAGSAPINYAWEVPITAAIGAIQTYQPITNTILGLRQSGPFSSLHIKLVDSTGTPLALGNTNWSLSLQFSTP
jgi:hypothetical protein